MSSEFEAADLLSKDLVRQLASAIPANRSGVKISATESWYSDPARRGFLYLIREGMLSYSHAGKTLFAFNEGDIVGIENAFSASQADLSCEFAVIVDEYSLESFFRHLHERSPLMKLWNEYLAQQFKLFSIMLANSMSDQDQPYVPDIRFVPEGDLILEEGSEGNELFSLIEGSAEVVKGGKVIDSVGADQIFGAVSALSQTPRAASVVAKTDCMVAVFNPDDLERLSIIRPRVVISLLRQLAEDLGLPSEQKQTIPI